MALPDSPKVVDHAVVRPEVGVARARKWIHLDASNHEVGTRVQTNAVVDQVVEFLKIRRAEELSDVAWSQVVGYDSADIAGDAAWVVSRAVERTLRIENDWAEMHLEIDKRSSLDTSTARGRRECQGLSAGNVNHNGVPIGDVLAVTTKRRRRAIEEL